MAEMSKNFRDMDGEVYVEAEAVKASNKVLCLTPLESPAAGTGFKIARLCLHSFAPNEVGNRTKRLNDALVCFMASSASLVSEPATAVSIGLMHIPN
jgi:hypothetical protein